MINDRLRWTQIYALWKFTSSRMGVITISLEIHNEIYGIINMKTISEVPNMYLLIHTFNKLHLYSLSINMAWCIN